MKYNAIYIYPTNNKYISWYYNVAMFNNKEKLNLEQ